MGKPISALSLPFLTLLSPYSLLTTSYSPPPIKYFIDNHLTFKCLVTNDIKHNTGLNRNSKAFLSMWVENWMQ